jgi:hypothetical protein
LPAEIRNHIFELAFRHTNVKIHSPRGFRSDARYRGFQSACGLLAACRQVRHEALPLFYAAVIFDFSTSRNSLHNQVFLDAFTRSVVHTIKVHPAVLEMIFQYWFHNRSGLSLWAGSVWPPHVQELAGIFPVLKHVHTDSWNIGTIRTGENSRDLLAPCMRDFFGKGVEVHVPSDE